jgi:hypothetical protein
MCPAGCDADPPSVTLTSSAGPSGSYVRSNVTFIATFSTIVAGVTVADFNLGDGVTRYLEPSPTVELSRLDGGRCVCERERVCVCVSECVSVRECVCGVLCPNDCTCVR